MLSITPLSDYRAAACSLQQAWVGLTDRPWRSTWKLAEITAAGCLHSSTIAPCYAILSTISFEPQARLLPSHRSLEYTSAVVGSAEEASSAGVCKNAQTIKSGFLQPRRERAICRATDYPHAEALFPSSCAPKCFPTKNYGLLHPQSLSSHPREAGFAASQRPGLPVLHFQAFPTYTKIS